LVNLDLQLLNVASNGGNFDATTATTTSFDICIKDFLACFLADFLTLGFNYSNNVKNYWG
jgi:hypothetical protein